MIDHIYELNSITTILNNDLEEKQINERRMCFFIKYYEKIYLITAAHNISNDSELYFEYNFCKLTDNKIFISEIDLLIIEVDSLENLYFDLDKRDYFEDYNYDLDSKELFFCNSKKQICKMEEIRYEISSYNCICLPDMLKFVAKYKGEELIGCSGCPVLMNDKICGIISGYNEQVIMMIPFIFVKRVLDEYTRYNNFSGLCGFYYKLKNANRNLFINGFMLSHNYYQKNLDSFKINDKIVELDGYPINNSQIYINQLDLMVNLETYINLYKTIHDVLRFKVVRNKQLIDLVIGCRDIYSSYSLDLNSNEYIYKISNDDRYFMPLNFKTFEFLIKFRNIWDDKKLMSKFKNKISNSISEKDILVFDPKNKYNILTTQFDDYLVLDL